LTRNKKRFQVSECLGDEESLQGLLILSFAHPSGSLRASAFTKRFGAPSVGWALIPVFCDERAIRDNSSCGRERENKTHGSKILFIKLFEPCASQRIFLPLHLQLKKAKPKKERERETTLFCHPD
jgi:hypothetical protein